MFDNNALIHMKLPNYAKETFQTEKLKYNARSYGNPYVIDAVNGSLQHGDLRHRYLIDEDGKCEVKCEIYISMTKHIHFFLRSVRQIMKMYMKIQKVKMLKHLARAVQCHQQELLARLVVI